MRKFKRHTCEFKLLENVTEYELEEIVAAVVVLVGSRMFNFLHDFQNAREKIGGNKINDRSLNGFVAINVKIEISSNYNNLKPRRTYLTRNKFELLIKCLQKKMKFAKKN